MEEGEEVEDHHQERNRGEGGVDLVVRSPPPMAVGYFPFLANDEITIYCNLQERVPSW